MQRDIGTTSIKVEAAERSVKTEQLTEKTHDAFSVCPKTIREGIKTSIGRVLDIF